MNRDYATFQRLIGIAAARPLTTLFVCIGTAASIFVFGLIIGFSAGRWSTTATAIAENFPDVPTADQPLTGARSVLAPHFSLFWEAMELIYRDYYGELPDAEMVTYGAIQSVLTQLGDPNTSLLTPVEAEFFRTNLEGSFEGIGARVDWDEDHKSLVITEPFENHPAWLAGLRRNDRIVAVDGDSIVGTDLKSAVARIRGPQGSPVVLTVQRPDSSFSFDLSIVRARIEIPTIRTDTIDNIAYIRLNSFNENAGQLVREAVRSAAQREPAGLILDLRGNTGGLLREAVKVTSVFLEDHDVLIERFSDDLHKTYDTVGQAVIGEIPLIILVNEGSASASEIVAGALQDAGRATIMGTQTFGKGSVQMPHTLSNGAVMRITVARWYTPLDRSIDGVGLTPDVILDAEGDESKSRSDLQLEAAIRYLRSGVLETD